MSRSLTFDAAVDTLEVGGVIVYPTHSLYGVGGDARIEGVVERIQRLKGRAPSHPFLMLMGSLADIEAVAEVDLLANLLAERYWPGPLTLLLPARPLAPPALIGPDGLIGVRIADHPVCRALIEATGAWLVSTSANRTGTPAPSSASDLDLDFVSETDGILRGYPEPIGTPTTIVALPRRDPPVVVREGAVSRTELLEHLLPFYMEHSHG